MKLEFDSIGELEQFLMFTAHIGKAFQTAPVLDIPVATGAALDKIAEVREATALGVAFAENAADDAMPGEMVQYEPEAPKRKRRTKAEMEAERAAVESNVQDTLGRAGETPADAAQMAAEVTGAANPFAVVQAVQAALDTPQQGAATLATIAAAQIVETAPPAVSNVKERALQILADPAAIESIAHLRACQGFIQKHGMPKYNESFKEGLNANIAVYTPEQRALHIAILESLDA